MCPFPPSHLSLLILSYSYILFCFIAAFKPRPKPWTPILGDRGDEYVEAGTPGTSPTITSSMYTKKEGKKTKKQIYRIKRKLKSYLTVNPLMQHDTHSRPSSGHFTVPVFPSSNPISIPCMSTYYSFSSISLLSLLWFFFPFLTIFCSLLILTAVAMEKFGSHDASPSTELEETANIAESAGNIGNTSPPFLPFPPPSSISNISSFFHLNILLSSSFFSVVRSALLELKGHSGPVIAASWTSSNSLATGSWDHSVRVWSADNGRIVANLSSCMSSSSFPSLILLSSFSYPSLFILFY